MPDPAVCHLSTGLFISISLLWHLRYLLGLSLALPLLAGKRRVAGIVLFFNPENVLRACQECVLPGGVARLGKESLHPTGGLADSPAGRWGAPSLTLTRKKFPIRVIVCTRCYSSSVSGAPIPGCLPSCLPWAPLLFWGGP